MILAAIGAGLFWAYQKYYLQTINGISIEGDQYQLVVSVDTAVDDSRLSVICMDNYGNAVTRGVVDGKATFTDLLPDTLYRIQLDISGFHKLVGQTSDIFTTKGSTRIASSLRRHRRRGRLRHAELRGQRRRPGGMGRDLLRRGRGDAKRKLLRSHRHRQGADRRKAVYLHRWSLPTLPPGKPSPGKIPLEFMASRLVLAENLTVAASSGSDMTVRWDAPGDVVVESWERPLLQRR